jgi:tryptophan-rich sensory protein
MRSPGLALADIVLLWVLIVVLIRLFWNHSRMASLLLVPYLLWVSFATALNATLWWMNR